MMGSHPARTGALPNLIVIGGQKCGTSALHYYLDLHPEVQMSSPKELRFFLAGEDFEPEAFISDPRERPLLGMRQNWSLGIEWYASHFSPEAAVRGEATPHYASLWYPGLAARMAGLVPDAKLIFLARHPIERIVSHYMHACAEGREWRALPEAVAPANSLYVARSRYASMLRPFLECYPRSRVLLLRQEDLLHRRRETMRRVFRFIGVEDCFWSPKMERERHPSRRKGWRFGVVTRLQRTRFAAPFYRLPQEAKWALERIAYSRSPAERPVLGDESRTRILEDLEPEITSLEELTGWDLTEWRAPARARS